MSFRVGYPVGNTKDRDVLQWPTLLRGELVEFMTANNPGDDVGVLWPVSITLTQILALAWRVRTWRLTGSFGVTAGHDGGPSHLFAPQQASVVASIQACDINVFGITDELGLISDGSPSPLGFVGLRNAGIGRFNPISFTFEAQDDLDPGFPTQSGTNTNATLNIFLNGGNGYEAVIYDPGTKKFSPYIAVAMGGANILLYGVNVKPVAATSNGLLTVTPGIAPAFTVPLYASGNYNPGGSPPPGAYSFGSAEMSLTATQFWPYKTSTGLPVYNESTGAQINDPFS